MESRFLRASAVTVVTATLLGACASQVQFPSGSPKRALTGQRHQPDDKSRHSAVILLAPCGGVTSHMGAWARWLNGLGYVTLIVDSQASRGTTSSCEGRGPGTYQVARDAVDALVYLRTLPSVDPDRVAAMGWSLGGTAALAASNSSRRYWRGYQDTPSFQAVVAFYPSCYDLDCGTNTPTLLLLAGRDDWTPPEPCLKTMEAYHRGVRMLRAEVYPDALHAFDRPETPMSYLGHAMAYDRGAAGAAHDAVRTFLAEELGGKHP